MAGEIVRGRAVGPEEWMCEERAAGRRQVLLEHASGKHLHGQDVDEGARGGKPRQGLGVLGDDSLELRDGDAVEDRIRRQRAFQIDGAHAVRHGCHQRGVIDIVHAHVEIRAEDGSPQPPEPAVPDDRGGGRQHGPSWYGGAASTA